MFSRIQCAYPLRVNTHYYDNNNNNACKITTNLFPGMPRGALNPGLQGLEGPLMQQQQVSKWLLFDCDVRMYIAKHCQSTSTII